MNHMLGKELWVKTDTGTLAHIQTKPSEICHSLLKTLRGFLSYRVKAKEIKLYRDKLGKQKDKEKLGGGVKLWLQMFLTEWKRDAPEMYSVKLLFL